MDNSKNYERLYKAIKSILRWHTKNEKNQYALDAYSFILGRMEKLEKLNKDIRDIEIEEIFINGESIP